jgi:putative ABC transport system permease protein
VEGTLPGAAAALRNGTGVLVSDNLAYKLDLRRGENIVLPTVKGPRSFTVEGTYVDYLGSLDLGAVLVGQSLLQHLWNDAQANMLRVWLQPDVASADVAERIRVAMQQLPSTKGDSYYVLQATDFLEEVRSAVRRFFAATWALQVIVALVGVIGVANTQLAAVLDRTTEVGVLRTVGLTRKAVVRSIMIECGALGAMGSVLGVVLGLILGSQIVLIGLRLVTGWSMGIEVPWGDLVVGVVTATAVSAIAGYIPARAAVQLDAPRGAVD